MFVAPELEQIRREVEAIISRLFGSSVASCAAGKMDERTDLRTSAAYLHRNHKGLRRALDNGSVSAGAPTWPHRVRKFVVTKLGWMPAGREAFRQIIAR